MKKKNLYFIIAVVLIIILVKCYDVYNKKSEDDIDTNPDDYYSVFATNYSSSNYSDGVPDLIVDKNETVHFRYAKNKETDKYAEAELQVKNVSLLDDPKNQDMDNDIFKEVVNSKSKKAGFLVFEEEYRYLYVDFTIKNMSDEKAILNLETLGINNKKNFGHEEFSRSGSFSYIKLIEDDKETVIEAHDFSCREYELEPDKEYLFEMVEIILPCEIENLYFLTNNSDDNLTNDQVGICLGLELNEEYDYTYRGRDLKLMRINAGYTSDIFFEEQQEGFEFSDNYFYNSDESVGKSWSGDGEDSIVGKNMMVLESRVINDKDNLPEKFNDSKYIEKTLDLYRDKYDYNDGEYRYVYTKIKLKELGNMKIDTVISNYLWLYNRDENNHLWVFGCADDYYIISSTDENQSIECQNIIMSQDEEIIIEAVYIALPDTIYDLYIYNNNSNGLLERGCVDNGDTEGAICLDIAKYEEGGIKK